MRGNLHRLLATAGITTCLALMGGVGAAHAASFNLTATEGRISTPDGGDIYMWGFAYTGESFRYPGPVLDVPKNDVVEVTLTNALPDPPGPKTVDPVSIVFPGQEGVAFCKPDQVDCTDALNWAPVEPHYTAANGDKGSLRSFAPEALPGDRVMYRFTAAHPGTYQYHSGTKPAKHVDMGLFGALIVRSGTLGQAYDVAGTDYDKEYLQIQSALDPDQHSRVERGLDYQASIYRPQYWFINGRSFPDTLSGDNAGYLPHQPMGGLIQLYPGERVLLRLITTSNEPYPMHHHGASATVIALNGRPLGNGSVERYTPVVNPGQTVDTIYHWILLDPADAGWDMTGNDPNAPVPVNVLPNIDNPNIYFSYGETYSGSPYLGKQGLLSPGDAAININMHGEMYVPFHSHHEHHLQNQDEGPGGMLTLIMICDPAQLLCGPNHAP